MRALQRILPALLASLLAATPGAARANAKITIVNVNDPGVGFNDPTPATPLANNPGTTVGAQRLYAFQAAADIWGATLDSNVEVFIQSSFVPLACTASSAVLGSAGAIQIFSDFPGAGFFPGAEFPATWYHVALANKRAGYDLAPAPGSLESPPDDIRARFNSDLGKTGCLTGTTWYYGVDLGHAANQINLVTVLLHEFAHGLGFSSFTSVSTGQMVAGQSDIYSRYYLDLTTGKMRDAMTDAERVASAINSRKVVWTGGRVTAEVPNVLARGTPLLVVNAPAAIAGNYQVGTASFGPQLGSPGITGSVVQALDDANASGPSTFDACTALTNAAAVAGNIAIVNRGTCTFAVKVKNCQNAGAVAVVVADNAAGAPPAGLGGADPTITIPSVRVTQADGNLIKAQLAIGVNATLGVDLSVRAGASADGRALLNAPNPVQPGSSISHWDPIAFPNQLMEPAINSDLTLNVDAPFDLTTPLMRDVGWFPDADLDGVRDDGLDQCLGSDLSPTVVIGGENTGVKNTLFPDGCTISDLVKKCAVDARNHGDFVSCVAQLGNGLVQGGALTGAQKGAIQRAAAHAPSP
jgi:hypothetical protein